MTGLPTGRCVRREYLSEGGRKVLRALVRGIPIMSQAKHPRPPGQISVRRSIGPPLSGRQVMAPLDLLHPEPIFDPVDSLTGSRV